MPLHGYSGGDFRSASGIQMGPAWTSHPLSTVFNIATRTLEKKTDEVP